MIAFPPYREIYVPPMAPPVPNAEEPVAAPQVPEAAAAIAAVEAIIAPPVGAPEPEEDNPFLGALLCLPVFAAMICIAPIVLSSYATGCAITKCRTIWNRVFPPVPEREPASVIASDTESDSVSLASDVEPNLTIND